MDSRALINETLKYLEKDEKGAPKYRFEVYNTGATNYIYKQAKSLGLNIGSAKEEKTMPVSVYTVGDLFDTLSDTGSDILEDISAIPDTLENIKASLTNFGFSALSSTIDIIKAAVVPIEVIQTVNEIYRVARPLVERIVDIASIMFRFENAAKVAQDILQYLSRLAVSTAKNYFDKLFNVLMDMPVFAIYENDDTVNLAATYSELADAANGLIDGLAEGAFKDIMKYANFADSVVYEPQYSNMGTAIQEEIVDVFHDINTRSVYIASAHKIYRIDNEYYAQELYYNEDDTIKNVFIFNEAICYLTTDNKVRKVVSNTSALDYLIKENAEFSVIYSNPVFIFNKTDSCLYRPNSETAVITIGNVLYHTYDAEKNTLYFIIKDGESYKRLIMSKDQDGNYKVEQSGVLSETPYGIAYFNNYLHVVLKNTQGKYYISKMTAGMSFDATNFSFDENKPEDGIIWADDNFTTDGSSIFSHINGSMIYETQAFNQINAVTKKSYNNKDYYVCSGGLNLYVTNILNQNGVKTYCWNTKQLNLILDEENVIPDNVAGINWYESDAYGTFLIANSQERIYLYGPEKISDIFNVVEPNTIHELVYKEFSSFKSWFDNEDSPTTQLDYSARIAIESGCIITAIRIIDKQIYVGIYNPNSLDENSSVNSGVYKASVSYTNGKSNLVIDYSHPVVSSKTPIKIYSFDKLNNCWWYTDGVKLYNATYSSEFELHLEEKDDRSIFVSHKTESGNDEFVVYTSLAILNEKSNETFYDVNSLVNYQTTVLPQIASTRNTLMLSDYDRVYNIIDNEDYEIDAELFQICYRRPSSEFRMIQSCDGVFIVSSHAIRQVPYYSSLTSYNYGCGYSTDTTLNKWYGAAPYYFASNVLNEKKNSNQRELFILAFRENFKVELTKLLKNIPDAFVRYTKEKLVTELKKLGVYIEGDDGQILNLIINSVADTTSNSLGMYIQEKFFEKIGDDTTYETFATQVYNACVSDTTNNMTKDFYDIFEELYKSVVSEAIMEKNIGKKGLSNSLLRYYQNHKNEWATSMTDLIDVDYVESELYEIPLNSQQILDKTTYRFSYKDNKYQYEYISNPSSKFLKDNIISGYLKDGKFYSDSDYTTEVDVRIKIGNDYYDADENIICYGDSNGNFYKYKLQDYILTTDTEIDTAKDYYTKSGDNQYIYSLTTDTEPQENKPYYKNEYSESTDSTVVASKTYYTKDGGGYSYQLQTEEILPDVVSYFIKKEYNLTSDTEPNDYTTYYTQSYSPASGSVEQGVQYYEKNYVVTSDTQIDKSKNYYEFLDLTEFVGSIYYEYNPSSTAQKYAPKYEAETGSLDLTQTYYIEQDGAYTLAENVDEQYGPYYKITGFEKNDSGEYVESLITSDSTYTVVANPVLSNLASYYELAYVPVNNVTSTSGKYVLTYVEVEYPVAEDMSEYYEKSSSYEAATDLNYIYDDGGNVVGIKNDRNLYSISYEEETYAEVAVPSGDPSKNSYYEKNVYTAIVEGTSLNPYNDGLFEREINNVIFNKVENPIKSKLSTYYEYSFSYSNVYDDGKIYVDLNPVSITSNFDDEDKKWHNEFYNNVVDAEAKVVSSDIEEAKAQALSALNEISCTIYPSDEWQMLITKSVSEYYIPIQGEQFRQIVLDSNMYPIQWAELPEDINHEAFDYALSALLYAIKQKLLTNITILVDGGKVKCYSCIDATTVIKKMVDRNGVIWGNQIKIAKSRISKAASVENIKKEFDMVRAQEESRYLLKNILYDQSRLYAKYIDQIIDAQIVNDNETEVTL